MKLRLIKHIRILCLAAVLALLAECVFSCISFFRGFGNNEQIIKLLPSVTEGYLNEGGRMMPQKTEAWMDFNIQRTAGAFRIHLSEPLPIHESVIIYYTENAAQEYDQYRRIDKYMIKGSTDGTIPLTGSYYDKIRIRIDGEFTPSSFEIVTTCPVAGIHSSELSKILSRFSPSRFILLLFVLFTLIVSCRKYLERKTEGGDRLTDRESYLDVIRILAAFFVIVVHVAEPVSLLQIPGSKRDLFFTAVVILSLTCNLLFIFISGALLLPYREETAPSFYRKRALKVLIPFVIYSFYYIKVMCISDMDGLPFFLQSVAIIVSGSILTAPHLWLIYVLLGLYIIAPFFRYMLKSMTEQSEKCLALMIIFFLCLRTFLVFTGARIGIDVFLDSWPGIFLMGYFLNRSWMRRYDGALLAGGAMALAGTLALSLKRADYEDIVCNCSIFMFLMSAAVFVLCLRGRKFYVKIKDGLRAVSNYSYSIILIHWFVIGILADGWFPVSVMTQTKYQILLPILFTCVLSFIIALVTDHSFVASAETGAGIICSFFSNTKKKQLEVRMKSGDRKKTIQTLPDGIWESSRTDHGKKEKKDKKQLTTDLQGNGYPVDQNNPEI